MNDKIENLTKSVADLVKMIASKPDHVFLHSEIKNDPEKGQFLQINIKVEPEDIPVCIGLGGRVAESIRLIACLIARKIEFDMRLFVRVDAPRMPKNHFDFKQ